MSRKVTMKDVEYIAKTLLLHFKELPGFKNAKIAEIYPIHGVTGRKIEYYEVKFSSPENKDNGYAIISATTNDLPVVEFSENGITHFERFQNIVGAKNFKMIRFGPNYVTAEDNKGNLLAEIGKRPLIIPKELQKHMRGEMKTGEKAIEKLQTPEIIKKRLGKKPRMISYRTFKRRYKRPTIKEEKLQREWSMVFSRQRNQGCSYNYYWADGYNNHPYFLQIPKNTPPNNNDHASGCGPTAWMNLIGWHDLNWTPDLLPGSHRYNDTYINLLTMACHDFIGTYEPWWTFDADQGFTWPDDMAKGYEFIRIFLRHACRYWYRYDWWWTDEDWVFEVARDVIRARRPFIVGYFQDWHYAIGYGVAECRVHGWREHSWIKIYPAWSWNDSLDKWIPKDTIFAIYGVYDFHPLLEFLRIENPQEMELVINGPSDANRLFVYTGTAVFASHGAIGSEWMRDAISFEIGRNFSSNQFIKATAYASLASIANQNHAVNAGWAVDRVDTELVPSGKVKVTLHYAIRDVDGLLLRVGYKVNVIAKL